MVQQLQTDTAQSEKLSLSPTHLPAVESIPRLIAQVLSRGLMNEKLKAILIHSAIKP